YQKFRFNTFDRGYSPSQHFAGVQDDAGEMVAETKKLPAYQSLIRDERLDDCGVAQLAGISVAVPFVSAFAGAVTVSQLIRLASGQAPSRVLTGTVGELQTLRGSIGRSPARLTFSTAQSKRSAEQYV